MDVIKIENFGDAIICPYNKSHIILADRIQWHLSRCRRQHPNAKIAVCCFNASHHIPEAELRAHQSICPDRVLVEVYKYPLDFGAPATWKTQEPEVVYNRSNDASGYVATQDENWDDMDAPPYNPQEYCLNNPVIRKATHMTRSEKRRFYAEEHIRITAIEKKRAEEKKKQEELEKEKRMEKVEQKKGNENEKQ